MEIFGNSIFMNYVTYTEGIYSEIYKMSVLIMNNLSLVFQSTSLDSGGVFIYQDVPGTGTGSGSGSGSRVSPRRWLSQISQAQNSRQYSIDEGVRGGPVGVGGPVSSSSSNQIPVLAPRRISPATDSMEISNQGMASRSDR